MSRHDSELTDERRDNTAPLRPKSQPSLRAALPPHPIVPLAKACCGCDALECGGTIAPSRIRLPLRAGDACGTGKG